MENAIKAQVTLKSLQTRWGKEKAELADVSRQIQTLKGKQRQHQERIQSIKRQMSDLTKVELLVSEHAHLRFLERVELIPVEQVSNRVVTEELKRVWSVLGDGEFPIGIGEHTCIIKNGVITTIK